ncbi:formimidoylglutamate deiminase [Puniceibacterium sp. IMCC21224]|uniref:formimidoylglutamate deiminase n=1 Tax=Puniceibacterium sp. IMCC21224 TaxID=1618204 RepID=UPI00064E0062|nr:formimidoylglutamate deiminase [Puniceibacterium sp. IMCC21224]KMK66833.1 formiminoglutamate deiminase [Puniceibacterium sp. IMCC21224]
MTLIRAAQALLPDGWASDVLVGIAPDGRIANVVQGPGQAADHHVGILLPAPVNVHSHAFQRAMAGLTERRGPDPSDSFWTWRRLMFRSLDRLTPDHVQAITAYVQMEMLEAGYATNAEFHYLHHQPGGTPYDNLAEMSQRVVAAASDTGIGLTLLPVHYQFGGCDGRGLGPGQIRFGCDPDLFGQLHADAGTALGHLPSDAGLGVAPHSLRAVGADTLRSYADRFPTGPIHMHLAEQIPEVDEVQAHWGARPVDWALDNMALDGRWCLIHCTQMTSDETIRLARTGAVAGLCPITESSLGDGIFDGVRWLGAGGGLAIGSDSNIRIALAEELRTLDYSQRLRDGSRAALASAEMSTGRRLYDATLRGGAQAIARDTGAIAAGNWGDLLVLDATSVHLEGREGDTVLDSWIFAGDDRLVTDVWSAGRHQVQNGQHVGRDAITAAYRRAMADLRDAL